MKPTIWRSLRLRSCAASRRELGLNICALVRIAVMSQVSNMCDLLQHALPHCECNRLFTSKPLASDRNEQSGDFKAEHAAVLLA